MVQGKSTRVATGALLHLLWLRMSEVLWYYIVPNYQVKSFYLHLALLPYQLVISEAKVGHEVSNSKCGQNDRT